MGAGAGRPRLERSAAAERAQLTRGSVRRHPLFVRRHLLADDVQAVVGASPTEKLETLDEVRGHRLVRWERFQIRAKTVVLTLQREHRLSIVDSCLDLAPIAD